MRKLAVLTTIGVLSFIGGGSSTASAHSARYESAKVKYYKANGIVKWIGNHAKVTQYHPNPKIKHHWQAAVHYWRGVRHDAWQTMHPAPAAPSLSSTLVSAFSCIHNHEGAWNANTGNGYYGGLQMDMTFQRQYGGAYLNRWGTANHWPTWAQLDSAIRAYLSGRGFGPWPNTARACGLL